MSYDEIGMTVNSDFNVPLNHLIWLQDYKTYGEDSYVFRNKSILHELYCDYRLTMNDVTATEAFSYAVEHSQIGYALQNIYGADKSFDWMNIKTIEDLTSNSSVFEYVYNNSVLCDLCFDYFVNNETAMKNLCKNRDALIDLFNNSLRASKFASSNYLLSACEESTLYDVISNNDSVMCNNHSARRTHYASKCFIVGMSQDYGTYTGYNSLIDTINGVVSCSCDISYGTTGLKWRVGKFADSAKCHPAAASGNWAITETSYMAILKIE